MNIIKRQPRKALVENYPTRKLYAVVMDNGILPWTTYDEAIKSATFFHRTTIIEDTFIDVSKARAEGSL